MAALTEFLTPFAASTETRVAAGPHKDHDRHPCGRAKDRAHTPALHPSYPNETAQMILDAARAAELVDA